MSGQIAGFRPEARLEALDDPLRSRLYVATEHLTRIERAASTIEDDALRQRLLGLVVVVEALVSHLSENPENGRVARTLLVIHLPSLSDALDVAAHALPIPSSPRDLTQFESLVSKMETLLARLGERLARRVQDQLDIRLDVWESQMRDEEL